MEQSQGQRPVRRQPDPIELAAYLLPVVLLVNSLKTPYLLTLNIVFAAAIFAAADVRRNPWTFLVLAACWVPDLVLRWFRHEDHVYLAVYWCLALGLSRFSADPVPTLRTNARLLIGLCFTFAVIAKIRAPEFLDGTLFHYILLVDHRFRDAITTTVGGLDSQMVVDNARMLASLNRWDAVGEVAVLHSPPAVRWVATLMTLGTVAIEGALAVVFLAPDRVFLARWRHTVLIGFCVAVYVVAPVVGFGCLFLGMGAAQCRLDQPRLRFAYVALYFVLLNWVFVRHYIFAGSSLI